MFRTMQIALALFGINFCANGATWRLLHCDDKADLLQASASTVMGVHIIRNPDNQWMQIWQPHRQIWLFSDFLQELW